MKYVDVTSTIYRRKQLDNVNFFFKSIDEIVRSPQHLLHTRGSQILFSRWWPFLRGATLAAGFFFNGPRCPWTVVPEHLGLRWRRTHAHGPVMQVDDQWRIHEGGGTVGHALIDVFIYTFENVATG